MKRRITILVIMMVFLCGTVFTNAADPAVSIISPNQTVNGNNLLISIKVTEPKTIKVYAYEEKQQVGDTLISIDPAVASDANHSMTIKSISLMMPETLKVTGNLQFYNKQINDLNPGLYRIKVETLDSNGEVTSFSNTRVVMMPKDEMVSGNAIFQTQQPGALQWVQNLLKSIFGN